MFADTKACFPEYSCIFCEEARVVIEGARRRAAQKGTARRRALKGGTREGTLEGAALERRSFKKSCSKKEAQKKAFHVRDVSWEQSAHRNRGTFGAPVISDCAEDAAVIESAYPKTL